MSEKMVDESTPALRKIEYETLDHSGMSPSDFDAYLKLSGKEGFLLVGPVNLSWQEEDSMEPSKPYDLKQTVLVFWRFADTDSNQS